MILLIDNYDSFTYNIYDYVKRLNNDIKVIKNDQFTLSQIKKMRFNKIILSPGPGNPDTAGVSLELIDELHQQVPIFGICLGHQIIAQYFGYQIIKAPSPMHGKIDIIWHDNAGIYYRLKNPLTVVRYHSLIVEDSPLETLQVSARNKEGIIMGLRHQNLAIESVQFHPEAIKTEFGLDMLRNFINKWT